MAITSGILGGIGAAMAAAAKAAAIGAGVGAVTSTVKNLATGQGFNLKDTLISTATGAGTGAVTGGAGSALSSAGAAIAKTAAGQAIKTGVGEVASTVAQSTVGKIATGAVGAVKEGANTVVGKVADVGAKVVQGTKSLLHVGNVATNPATGATGTATGATGTVTGAADAITNTAANTTKAVQGTVSSTATGTSTSAQGTVSEVTKATTQTVSTGTVKASNAVTATTPESTSISTGVKGTLPTTSELQRSSFEGMKAQAQQTISNTQAPDKLTLGKTPEVITNTDTMEGMKNAAKLEVTNANTPISPQGKIFGDKISKQEYYTQAQAAPKQGLLNVNSNGAGFKSEFKKAAGSALAQAVVGIPTTIIGIKQARQSSRVQREGLDLQRAMYNEQKAEAEKARATKRATAMSTRKSLLEFASSMKKSTPSTNIKSKGKTGNYSVLTPMTKTISKITKK